MLVKARVLSQPTTLLLQLVITLKQALGDDNDFIRMTSPLEQVHVSTTGQTANLDCDWFAPVSVGFNLFDNPVVWRKTQRDEAVLVNLMGNVLEPFESTMRFKVVFVVVEKYSRFRLGLTISDLSPEDSGNYTCEVNGPFNVLLGFVTHYLFIRAPVLGVQLVTYNSSTEDVDEDEESLTGSHRFYAPPAPVAPPTPQPQLSLPFVENVPSTLRCIAVGGYPPPDVSIMVGSRDVTQQFGVTHTTQLSGTRGLRVIHHVTERWSHNFRARADDSFSPLECAVTVSGLPPTRVSATLITYHAPIIECEPSWANHGDRNVFIRCRVKAKPDVAALFWVIDANGTTLSEGQVVNEHWTLVMDHGDGRLEVQLFIRQTRPDSFHHHYRLVAENSVSANSGRAALLQYKTNSQDVANDYSETPREPRRQAGMHSSFVQPKSNRLNNNGNKNNINKNKNQNSVYRIGWMNGAVSLGDNNYISIVACFILLCVGKRPIHYFAN